jgi:hypothetical protein
LKAIHEQIVDLFIRKGALEQKSAFLVEFYAKIFFAYIARNSALVHRGTIIFDNNFVTHPPFERRMGPFQLL